MVMKNGWRYSARTIYEPYKVRLRHRAKAERSVVAWEIVSQHLPKAIDFPGQVPGERGRMKTKIMKGIATQTLLALTVLTAAKGVNYFAGHTETWYSLKMDKVVQRANEYFGLSDAYRVREDGVKTYNGLVICATDWKIHPYGSIVETSLGTGIVLDHHTAEDKTIVDIATEW